MAGASEYPYPRMASEVVSMTTLMNSGSTTYQMRATPRAITASSSEKILRRSRAKRITIETITAVTARLSQKDTQVARRQRAKLRAP